MLRDRRVEKADPNSASVTAMNPPTTDAPFMTLRNDFIPQPLDAFRKADLELDDVEIWIAANTGLKVSRRRKGECQHPLFMLG